MMKRRIIWLLLPLGLFLLTGAGLLLADFGEHDDDDYGERGFFSRWMGSERMVYNTAYSELYREECGSCHFPFQPGLLPGQSWQAIMQGLDDHFGENAELADAETQQITEYLLRNAADRGNGEIPHKVMYSLRFTPNPLRVTETAFFRHEHRELPPWVLQQQDRQLTFANCDSCHTRALQGSYNEHEIRIPGIGRWDD